MRTTKVNPIRYIPMITTKEVRSLICEHGFSVPANEKEPCCPLCAHPHGDACVDVDPEPEDLQPLNIALLRVGVVLGERMLTLTRALERAAKALLAEKEKARLLMVENGKLRACMLEHDQLNEKPLGSVQEANAARQRWESALRGE